jgi:putative ABC transport system substrate-binding protein
MRRRQFITALGGAAAASFLWPLAARAQQAGMPVVGLLRHGARGESPQLMDAFLKGLRETGFVENRNVAIEYRWADGHYDRIPALLADLVRRQVAVLAVPGSTISALAAKAATRTIPIVFLIGSDPVELGLVAGLARPGGNLTGFAQLMAWVVAKRLDLLRQAVPKADTVALLINPTNPFGEAERREMEATAQALGLRVHVAETKDDSEIDEAFPTMIAQGVGALVIGADAYFFYRGARLASLTARHSIPAISNYREFAVDGGLMSYGPSIADGFRLTGVYVGRILRGERPADLPIIQPAKFDFLINLKAAKALKLEVPPTLLALADEVIE